MKLRNKKTGEIGSLISGVNMDDYQIATDDYTLLGKYETLAKLNEDWEDYKQVEPLIKDEKIRKAVRAWADVQGIKEVKHIEGVLSSDFWHLFEYGGHGSNRGIIHWGRGVYIANLEDGKTYTITELCGEEAEWQSH